MVQHGGDVTTQQIIDAINEAGYMDVEQLGSVTQN